MDFEYSLELAPRGGSNEYTQSKFGAAILNISEFLSESFQFWRWMFFLYLNSHVFVMTSQLILMPVQITNTGSLRIGCFYLICDT